LAIELNDSRLRYVRVPIFQILDTFRLPSLGNCNTESPGFRQQLVTAAQYWKAERASQGSLDHFAQQRLLMMKRV
jgi:hypothetical protein